MRHCHTTILLSAFMLLLSACGKQDIETGYTSDPAAPLSGDFNPDLPAGDSTPDPAAPAAPANPPDSGTPAPPDDPIRETRFCQAEGGLFREEPSLTQVTRGRIDRSFFAEGGGCILRPLSETWLVARNQPLMAWNDIVEFSFTQRADLPPGVAFFFDVHYVAGPWINRVNWNMSWFHSVPPDHGTLDQPKRVLINYKKVSGTKYIRSWEGTIFLDRVSVNVTGFAMRNQIDATQTGEDDAVGAIRDVLEKLRRGSPALQ